MARQTMTLSCTASAFITSANPNSNAHGAGSYKVLRKIGSSDPYKMLLLGFSAFPSTLYKKIIYSSTLDLSTQVSDVDISFDCDAYNKSFSEGSVTYNSFDPDTGGEGGPTLYPSSTSLERNSVHLREELLKYQTYAVQGLMMFGYSSSESATVYTRNATSSRRPVITIEYDDTDEATSKVTGSSPKSGYVDPEQSKMFSWSLSAISYKSVDPFVQTSATMYWSDDDGTTWNSVAASGSTQYVTIPANTFPRGTIKWYVTATDDRGSTTTSPTYTISTADQVIVPTPVSPSGTVEDGSEPILFKWNINSPSGTAPTASRLFYRLIDDVSWTYVDVPGSGTSYTMAGGTLGAGTYAWGVFTKNQAGTWSSASSTLQFVCVAAPEAPSVSADGAPFATIDWQADGQQAYRITVDGKVYGPYFGTTKTFTLPDYLEDGEHTASVEIQGTYGLWSQAGTVTFTVANVPGDAVTLTGDFDRDAALSWATTSTTADFLIYRDGEQIGHTAKLAFTDRLVLGQHSWQVINRLAGGYYTASNTVQGTLKSCVTAISALSGGGWMELKLSDRSDSEQTFTWTRTTSLRHIAGAVYPVLETSPFEDGAGTYDVSFPDVESAREFERFKGRTVILKSRGGEVMIGCLSSLNKGMYDFYITYQFTIQRIHWEDFVDDT